MFFHRYFQGRFITLPKISYYRYDKKHLVEHKEVVVICEESGHVSMNYNALLTTP
jgi:hypothetical protein